jgi:hypothetical protein
MAERKDGQPRTVRNGDATPRVLEYLRRNPNVVMPYHELKAALDLPLSTIANSVGYLMHVRGVTQIERPMKGTVIYHSAPVDYDLTKTMEAEKPKVAIEYPIADTDAISAYPVQIVPDTSWDGVTDMSDYSPHYEYVGKMGEREIIRDTGDQLYVAVPLLDWVIQR